ncbi:MAG: hypothetical protein AB1645_08405 [Bacillota bacterium]|jgi:hypothetical protein
MAYRGTRRYHHVNPYTWPAFLVGVFLILAGLFIAGYWVSFILQGGMTGGLWTVENGTYLVFHQAAEVAAAVAAVAGGYGLLRGRPWGLSAALVALGALLYATINALGFSVYARPELFPALAATLGAVLLSFVALRYGRR